MKNYVLVQRSYKDKIVDSINCDVCNRNHPNGHWRRDSSFDIIETEVKLKTGYIYPEGGSGTEISYDICPDCFRNVLIPLFESIGVHPRTEDWES